MTIVGLCQGGWEAAIYAALHPGKAERLILAGSPLDFDAGNGQIKRFAQSAPFAYFEWLVACGGGPLDGRFLLWGFQSMRPVEHFVKRPLEIYQHADEPVWRARDRRFRDWYEHTYRLPGRWYLEAVKWLFRENRMVKGTVEVSGRRVNLGAITCPVTLVAGATDDVTPPAQLFDAAPAFGGPVTPVLIPAGHIGLFMSKEAVADSWPRLLAPTVTRPRLAAVTRLARVGLIRPGLPEEARVAA